MGALTRQRENVMTRTKNNRRTVVSIERETSIRTDALDGGDRERILADDGFQSFAIERVPEEIGDAEVKRTATKALRLWTDRNRSTEEGIEGLQKDGNNGDIEWEQLEAGARLWESAEARRRDGYSTPVGHERAIEALGKGNTLEVEQLINTGVRQAEECAHDESYWDMAKKISERAGPAATASHAGDDVERALLNACAPLMLACETGELEDPRRTVFEVLDQAQLKDEEQLDPQYRMYSEKRGNPDIDVLLEATNGIHAWGENRPDEETAEAVKNWICVAHEIAMTQVTRARSNDGVATACALARKIIPHGKAEICGDGTITWTTAQGDRTTLARTIANAAGPTPGAYVDGAHVAAKSGRGESVRLNREDCIKFAEASGSRHAHAPQTSERVAIREAILEECGLGKEAAAEASLRAWCMAKQIGENKVGGQSEAWNKTVERGIVEAIGVPWADGSATRGISAIDPKLTQAAITMSSPSSFTLRWTHPREHERALRHAFEKSIAWTHESQRRQSEPKSKRASAVHERE